MKALLYNIRLILVIFMIIAVGLIAGLVVQENRSRSSLRAAAGENKQALASRYSQAGTIYSADGVTLAYSGDDGRGYADDREIATSFTQLVGDYTHNIANTIESDYQGFLLGTDRPLLHQLRFDLGGKGLEGDDITLTLNAELNKYALQQMGDNKGACVLLNYRTGDILASVSTPSVDPTDVVEWNEENIPDSSLFNKAFLGTYAPGSTFKYITSAAWMQSKDYDPDLKVKCLAPNPLIEPDGVKEDRDESHGDLTIEQAMEVSCNYFFGEVAVKSGRKALLETARKFGIGGPLPVDKLKTTQSEIKIPDRDSSLSWVAIGQPVADAKLTLTPVEMACMVGSVANNGDMMAPHVVDHMTSPLGTEYEEKQVRVLMQTCTPEIAGKLDALLYDAVENGTGDRAKIDGFRVCGKTGTAQVEGQEEDNSLFIGYVANSQHPYAVCVICEDAGLGSEHAAPIAGAVMQKAIELNAK